MSGRILIVEDEARIASFVQKGLRAQGYSTMVAAEGHEALEAALSGEFDLLVLDLGFPGLHGFDVLTELRKRDRRMPIVILTASDSLEDTVAGLDSGADDYITKPFRFKELLARVRARLRAESAPGEEVLVAGKARLDLKTSRAYVGEKMIELTAREFALAEVSFRHPGQVPSREQLLSRGWGYY
jgi:two-component system copper resistance phosphate regulon response regulator CusR